MVMQEEFMVMVMQEEFMVMVMQEEFYTTVDNLWPDRTYDLLVRYFEAIYWHLTHPWRPEVHTSRDGPWL